VLVLSLFPNLSPPFLPCKKTSLLGSLFAYNLVFYPLLFLHSFFLGHDNNFFFKEDLLLEGPSNKPSAGYPSFLCFLILLAPKCCLGCLPFFASFPVRSFPKDFPALIDARSYPSGILIFSSPGIPFPFPSMRSLFSHLSTRF